MAAGVEVPQGALCCAPRGARGWYSPGWEGGGGRAAALWLEGGKREQGLFSINAAATGNSSEAAGGQRSRRSQWQPRPVLSGARGRGSSRSPGTPRSALQWNRPGAGPQAAPGPVPAVSSAHPARPSLGWAGGAGPKASPPSWGAQPQLRPSSRDGFGEAAGVGASPTEVGDMQGPALMAPKQLWPGAVPGPGRGIGHARAGGAGPRGHEAPHLTSPQWPLQAGLGETGSVADSGHWALGQDRVGGPTGPLRAAAP